MMDMEYNRTSPFISNCLHYSSEFHPYVGEFAYICNIVNSSLNERKNLHAGIFNFHLRFPFLNSRRLIKSNKVIFDLILVFLHYSNLLHQY